MQSFLVAPPCALVRRARIPECWAVLFGFPLLAAACTEPSGPDPQPPVVEIRVSPDTVALYVGQTISIDAVAYDWEGEPIEDAAITFSMTSPLGALDTTGTFRAIFQGETVIRATSGYASAEIPVKVTHFTSIALYARTLCGVDGRNETWCIGWDPAGVFGGDDFNDRWMPLPGELALQGLSNGYMHSCGIVISNAYCWGLNDKGGMGSGDGGDYTQPPTLVVGGHVFSQVEAGWEHTCGIDGAGAAWCWGRGFEGQLGSGASTASGTPVEVAGGHTWVLIDAGDTNTCGVATDGLTYCWGDGDAFEPEPVPGLLEDAQVVRAGFGTVCVASGADVECAGNADFLPDPASVVFPTTVIDIALSLRSACALLANAQIHCWGSNEEGMLGVSDVTSADVPVRVDADESFLAVTGVRRRHCGLAGGGAVYCWGADGGSGSGWSPVPASAVPTLVPAPRP